MSAITAERIQEVLGYGKPIQIKTVPIPDEHLAELPAEYHNLRGKKRNRCNCRSYPLNADRVFLQTFTTRMTHIEPHLLGKGNAVYDILIQSLEFRANQHFSLTALIRPLDESAEARLSVSHGCLRSFETEYLTNDLQRILCGYERLYRQANGRPSAVYGKTRRGRFWQKAGF